MFNLIKDFRGLLGPWVEQRRSQPHTILIPKWTTRNRGRKSFPISDFSAFGRDIWYISQTSLSLFSRSLCFDLMGLRCFVSYEALPTGPPHHMLFLPFSSNPLFHTNIFLLASSHSSYVKTPHPSSCKNILFPTVVLRRVVGLC